MDSNAQNIQKDRIKIEDPAVLRILLHPLRTRLVTALSGRERTVRELASIVELAPTKLYYHLRLLEKAGLVLQVGERMVGNLIERSYRTAAREFDLGPELAAPWAAAGKDAFVQSAGAALSAARDSMIRSYRQLAGAEKGGSGASLSFRLAVQTGSLTPQEARDFEARLSALIEELGDPHRKSGPGARPFELALAFYPAPSAEGEGNERP